MSIHGSIKKAAIFVGLTYVISYSLLGAYFALGGRWKFPGYLLITLVYMFVPMTVALIVQKGIYKEQIVGPLGVSFHLNKWFYVAWLLPPILALATLGVSLLLPGVAYDPAMAGFFERMRSTLTPEQVAQAQEQMKISPIHPFWLGLMQGMVAGITVNALAAFGEELGWRGLLQKELGFLGFWRMSAVIGVIWGFWHAPIILQGYNYPQHPVLGVFMMTVWTMLLAPLFSYIRLKSKSVIAASVLHGTLNGTAGLAVIVVRGGSDLTIGMTGLAGFIVLALANLVLFFRDRNPAIESYAQPEGAEAVT